MTSESKKEKPTITLDEVFRAMQHWRNNKSQYEGQGIPDDVWKMIFLLGENGYLAKDIRRTFSINSQQYEKKKKEFATNLRLPPELINNEDTHCSNNEVEDIFCEVSISPDPPADVPPLAKVAKKTKQSVTTLKSTTSKPHDYLDMTTIIVEYLRPDGHRLKIHTTSASIDKVMSAFAQQGHQIND
jgi:hypothetical protein